MSAYPATLTALPSPVSEARPTALGAVSVDGSADLLDALLDRLASRIVARLADYGSPERQHSAADEWLDSRQAADFLGVHRDTLRKLAAERAIPSEQDGPNCKLFFRRSDLDAWRQSGGRPRQLSSTLRVAA